MDNDRVAITHNISAGTNLKPDSLTDINFKVGYSYSTTDENIDAAIDVMNSKAGAVSKGAGNQFNNTYNNNYNHNLFITRRFKAKRGRTLNLSQSTSYTSSLQRYITESANQYFYPFNNRFFNQLRRQDIPALSATTNLTYS